MTLPNAYLIGAAKCGTTSLAAWLDGHYDVCVSRPKEPRFLARSVEYVKGIGRYEESFKHYDGEKYVIDARPQNMIVGFVPERIKLVCGDVSKFIVCVRDPIERVYSAIQQFTRMRPGREIRNFDEVVEINLDICNINCFDLEMDYELQSDPGGGTYRLTYVEAGMYWEQMAKFRRTFPKADIKYFELGDMFRNSEAYLGEVCDFLEIERSGHKIRARNLSAAPTRVLDLRRLYPMAWRDLADHFHDGVVALGKEMDRDLIKEWWG